MSDQD